jgi:hypothetical protein
LLKRSIMETARLHREQQLPDIDVLVRSLIELVELCDREEAGAGLPDLYAARLYRDFDILVHAFDQVTRTLRPDEAATFGGYVQEQLLPLMKRGANSSRWFEKPRGYAGDFLTIAKIYDDVATWSRRCSTSTTPRCPTAVHTARGPESPRKRCR